VVKAEGRDYVPGKPSEESKITKRNLFWIVLAIVFIIGGFYGWHEYRVFMSAPTTRLTAGGYYPQMPPDDHHIYIQLPIDHDDPFLGTFTDFYLLNPSFKPGDNVVFKLYDNQQEAVGMIGESRDYEYFDEGIGKNISYVLIGNRGVNPTLFPELFDKNGKPDYALALKLYGSDEQIEDIEAVRLDMVKRGLLPKDGKIILHGGSGGGVLIQQYLNKYGEHVSRVFIESTGAPDIAKENNLTFTKSFYSSNKEAAEIYYKLFQEGDATASLAWLLFKVGLEGNPQLQTDILKGKENLLDLRDKFLYAKNWLKFSHNLPLINLIFRSPSELEVKVRIWEVAGYDLINYNPSSAEEINLLYESLRVFLSDFLDAYKAGRIPIYDFNINRSNFNGEVMVWANTGDQDFGPQIAGLITAAYPHSRLAVFEENAHHVQKKSEYQLDFIKAFIDTGLNSSEIQKYFNDNNLAND
jgi:pimeloyl-ACP methyl ester carboxylesterase